MSTNFPTSLDVLANPAASDGLTGHAAQHANANDAIEALEAKVGVTGSANPASIDYRVASVESGKVDKVAGKQLSTEDYSTLEKQKLAGISGTNTGDQTSVTGNAGTATKLQTARTINGVSFDGGANITINAVDSTARIASSEKGAANGVAPLGADLKIAAAYLPSYVDDVLEYANQAAFPASGETGKIYVALDSNKPFRWSGSAYVEISASPGSTDAVTEGSTNLYFTAQRVRDAVLTGLSTATNAVISATDTVLGALGKLQKQISTNLTTLTNHTGNTSNPHSVTKAQVGLNNVDNVADVNKPISTATQTALNAKANLSGALFTGAIGYGPGAGGTERRSVLRGQ